MSFRIEVAGALALAIVAIGCGSSGGKLPIDVSKLPKIEIVLGPAAPTPVPTPTPPPVVAPLPPEQAPVSEPEPPPIVLKDLLLHVSEIQAGFATPSRAVPIPNPWCVINGERRVGDGSGFIHYPVPGPVTAECGAAGYSTRSDIALDPGDRPIYLARAVTPSTRPPESAASAACDAANNTGRVSQFCIDAVAASSANAEPCRTTGEVEPCHLFTREVAIALRTAQNDDRWGLIKKTQGGENFDGSGVDVIAYLPRPLSLTEQTYRWNGVDIIGGLGLPNARLIGGALHRVIECGTPEMDIERWCNRHGDLWAPVPLQ